MATQLWHIQHINDTIANCDANMEEWLSMKAEYLELKREQEWVTERLQDRRDSLEKLKKFVSTYLVMMCAVLIGMSVHVRPSRLSKFFVKSAN